MLSEKNIAESLSVAQTNFYDETQISKGFFILKFNNETDDIHGTNEICRPQAKKAGRGVEEMTTKQKQIINIG